LAEIAVRLPWIAEAAEAPVEVMAKATATPAEKSRRRRCPPTSVTLAMLTAEAGTPRTDAVVDANAPAAAEL